MQNSFKTNAIVVISFLTMLSATSSCKKESPEPKKPTQNVLDSIQKDFTKEISAGSSGAYAVGYDFTVTDTGVINQLALTTPSPGTYKVMLYNTDTDVQDSAIFIIALADTGKVIYKNIPSVKANVGDYFRLTFNDLDKPQYQFLRTGGMNHLYGSIRLRWYVYQAQLTSSSIDGPFYHNADYTFGGVGCTFVKD